jgi:hypothetical protein
MGYGARDLKRIAMGICLECKEADARPYRRCLRCRRKKAKAKPKPPNYHRQRKADREAMRGYWPDIHGAD